MDTSKIIIVPKLSMYELDLSKYNVPHEELIEKYCKEGIDADRILSSHKRQKESLDELKRFFLEKQFIPRDKLTKEIANSSDIVISLGGDNHLQYVSHFIDDTLLMGINSDYVGSLGALTYFAAKNFETMLRKIEQNYFEVEKWTRLEAKINNIPIQRATTEYLLGQKEMKSMSRHIIKANENEEEQQCSGLLVVTGSGSTGWYDSSCRYIHKDGNKFPKTEEIAVYLAKEPVASSKNKMLEGILKSGEELTVASLNDDGIISPDCIEEYQFNRGAIASIKISDKPLKVINIKNET